MISPEKRSGQSWQASHHEHAENKKVGLRWQYALEEGYIWTVSANQGRLAVLDPKDGAVVHILDTQTGEQKAKIQKGWPVDSLTITDNQEFLLTRGVHDTSPNAKRGKPAVFISPSEQGRFSQFRGEIPAYDKEIWFGKIAVLPDKQQAFITGVSDRSDTKGFLLLADWEGGFNKGQISQVATQIDEAPHDVSIADERAYVATGRGGTIDVFDLRTKTRIKQIKPLSSAGEVFKPMQLAVSPNYIVAASYNCLLWWSQNEAFVGQEDFGNSNDCINGLTNLKGNTFVCSLTYSDQLFFKDVSVPSTAAIKIGEPGQQVIENPGWVLRDPQLDNRLYVTGHTNGVISAIDL